MASTKRIVVIGSINMDLVARVPRIPVAGETILGDSLATVPGGKGANQAVAAAKLVRPDTEVHMIGRVGGGDFGQRLLSGLDHHHVKTQRVTITEGTPSGVAMILVDKKGENTIVVTPGANAKLSPKDIDAAEELIDGASVVVLQLEIPLETVAHVIAMCQRLKVFTILDPAPMPPDGLPRALYGVDILTPNQIEADGLLGLETTRDVMPKRSDDQKLMASELLGRGAKAVVLKRGARGAVMIDRDGVIRTIRPHKVKIVDTTAAGDAFTAALAVAHGEGQELPGAVRFANAAGAACCQDFGAQPALPTREAVEKLLEMEGSD
ncbi:MAG TPA: ribokinase [Tepidisphaeraceae bacterium]|jgi:ribokinase|nr:ribokinase [Tepidisphaeraceae bacterium]